MRMERLLEKGTGVFLFESQFVADRFERYVGRTDKPVQVFLNGLHPDEFAPVEHAPTRPISCSSASCAMPKGIDLMLQGLASLGKRLGRRLTLSVVGAGPDEAAMRSLAGSLGLGDAVTFRGAMPARAGFATGKRNDRAVAL